MVRMGLSSGEWQCVRGKNGGGINATTLVFGAGRGLGMRVYVARRPNAPDGASSALSEGSVGDGLANNFCAVGMWCSLLIVGS